MIAGFDRQSALRAGATASVVMALVMLVLRLLLAVPTLPELVAERVIGFIPLAVFSALLATLGESGRPLLFFLVLLGQVVVLAAIGRADAVHLLRSASAGSGPLSLRDGTIRAHSLSLASGLWLLLMLVLAPLLGIGLFGTGLGRTDTAAFVVSYAGALLLYAFTIPTALTWRRRPRTTAASHPASSTGLTRRELLMSAGLGAGAVAAIVVVSRLGTGRETTPPATAASAGGQEALTADGWPASLPPEITPTDDFYVVSKNFPGDPRVDAHSWTLQLTGLVDQPLSLTHDELLQMPWQEQVLTLECISNEVGGDLISTARWRGVRLADLLERAGIKPGVVDVVLLAEDDYSDSIPLAKAREEGVLLALEMNGAPLPPAHGFPARLLVPGIYGMKNVKWLRGIQLVDYDFQGFWQNRGWSDQATIKTTSQVRAPARPYNLPFGATYIGGIAFAGNRGVSRVQVSVDAGQSWLDARLKPALSPYSWVLWALEWTPPQPGSYAVLVRAADGTGAFQAEQETDTLPDGASGYDRYTLNFA